MVGWGGWGGWGGRAGWGGRVVRVDEVVVLVEVDWLKKLNVTPKKVKCHKKNVTLVQLDQPCW